MSAVSVTELPPLVRALAVERTGPTTLRATLSLATAPTPALHTSVVFILDVSTTNRDAIESGRMGATVIKVLETLIASGADGIDLFLASVLEQEGPGSTAILAALANGRSPTETELSMAHGALAAGRVTTREALNRLLPVDGASVGLAGVLAPALRAAKSKRRQGGRLHIEVLTDGRLVDGDAVLRELISMANECSGQPDRHRFRVHFLGMGDVDVPAFERWRSQVLTASALDTVSFDLVDPADPIPDGVSLLVNSLRRSCFSVAAKALSEVSAAGLRDVRLSGVPMVQDEDRPDRFVEWSEQLPPDLVFECAFADTPSPVRLSVQPLRDDGAEPPIVLTIPVPPEQP